MADGINGVTDASENADACAKKRITASDLWSALDRQQYLCALSNRELTPQTASVDHILPLSRGGTHTPDNIQILSADVNRCKGSLTNAEFVELCKEIAARHA
jgi:5-methylcytosine-specific restriction endonuclease McrA